MSRSFIVASDFENRRRDCVKFGLEVASSSPVPLLSRRQYNFGLLHMERHEFPAAINALTIATKLGPAHSETHFNLSLTYECAGLMAEARKEILAPLKLEPDQPGAQNTLAVIDAKMGNYQDARAVLGEADSHRSGL